jgi:phage tail-like protein
VGSLRVYYPRFSYLERYVPGVYREEPVSASFLDRYLANPEGLFTALEDHIAKAEGLFDARITPPEYLEWLAGWFDYVLDPDWEESRKRLFLKNASLLFEWRSTVIGMWRRPLRSTCPDESIRRASGRARRRRSGTAMRCGSERFLSRSWRRGD